MAASPGFRAPKGWDPPRRSGRDVPRDPEGPRDDCLGACRRAPWPRGASGSSGRSGRHSATRGGDQSPEQIQARQAGTSGGTEGMALGKSPRAGWLGGPTRGRRPAHAGRLTGTPPPSRHRRVDSACGAPGRDDVEVGVHPRRGIPTPGGNRRSHDREIAYGRQGLPRAGGHPLRGAKRSASGGVRSRVKPRLRERAPEGARDRRGVAGRLLLRSHLPNARSPAHAGRRHGCAERGGAVRTPSQAATDKALC